MAADRGPYIDQSQSLNIHIAEPNYGKLSSMHFYSWKMVGYDTILLNFKRLHIFSQVKLYQIFKMGLYLILETLGAVSACVHIQSTNVQNCYPIIISCHWPSQLWDLSVNALIFIRELGHLRVCTHTHIYIYIVALSCLN